MYWEQNCFDDKLKKLLKWEDWEYEAYNTYRPMVKQKIKTADWRESTPKKVFEGSS